MHHKKGIFCLLICVSLLFSCKTASKVSEQSQDDTVEQSSTATEIQGGIETGINQAAEDSAGISKDESTELIDSGTELSPQSESKLNIDWVEEDIEEESFQKKIPPRGGIKDKLSAAREDSNPESTAEEIEPQAPVEEMTEESIPSAIKEISAIDLIDDIKIDETVAPDETTALENDNTPTVNNTDPEKSINDNLPSELDEIPANPLLPIMIKAQKEEKDAETAAEKEAEIDDAPIVEEIVHTQPDLIIPEEEEPAQPDTVPVIKNSPIEKNDYSLSTDPSGKLIIHLQGAGWVFLSGSGASELKLRDKSYEPGSGRTRFAFTVKGDGEYDAELVFMKQDLLKGESEQKVLTIDKTNSPSEPDTVEKAESDSEVPGLSEKVSDESVPLGDSEPAEGPEDSAEITGSDSEENQRVMEEAERTVSIPPVDPEQLNAAELYELALKYETPGPDQSLERAMELYIRIKNKFPVTEERFMAESRIRYLNKHYFKVQ